MPSIRSLVKTLQFDFPQFTFIASQDFRWSVDQQRIFYDKNSANSSYLLHELAHGLLAHSDYKRDIELLAMERDAWHYAIAALSKKYSVRIEEENVQDSLDTYRDWLHSRSTCPNCTAVGVQTNVREYSCLACGERWRVNDARSCALRRYSLTKKNTPI